MSEEVEIKTVDTILDQGVRVPIPAPFLFRLVGKKTINVVVRRPVIGNMLRISKMYIKMGIGENEIEEGEWRDWIKLFEKTAVPASRIVAVGMLRGKWRGWLFARPLAYWLRWKVNSREIAEMAAMLVSLSGVQDFMNTIKFLQGMKMTAPANLSQE